MYDLLLLRDGNVLLIEDGIFDEDGVLLYVNKYLYDTNIKNATDAVKSESVNGIYKIFVGLVDPVFVVMKREMNQEELDIAKEMDGLVFD
ncbi:MAG: hypothetical protein ACRCZZ_10850 [Phocaeicola sp.]